MTSQLNGKSIKQFVEHAILSVTLSAIFILILVSNPGLLRFEIQVLFRI